jgi:hypothetical protein
MAVLASGATTARSLAAMAGDVASLPNFILPSDPDAGAGLLRAIATGKTVFVPPGTWNIENSVQLPTGPVSIIGHEGASAFAFSSGGQILQPNNALTKITGVSFQAYGNAIPLTIAPTFIGGQTTSFVRLDKIDFQNFSSSSLGALLSVSGTNQARFSALTFEGTTNNVDNFLLTGSNQNPTFNQCNFGGQNSGYGLHVVSNGTSGAAGVRVSNCMGIGGRNGMAFDGGGTGGVNVVSIQVSNCMMDSVANPLYLNNVVYATFSNCWFAADTQGSYVPDANVIFGVDQANAVDFVNCNFSGDGTAPYVLDANGNTGGVTVNIFGGSGVTDAKCRNVTPNYIGQYANGPLSISGATINGALGVTSGLSVSGETLLAGVQSSGLVTAETGFQGGGTSGPIDLYGTTATLPATTYPNGSTYTNSSGSTGTTYWVLAGGTWKNLA